MRSLFVSVATLTLLALTLLPACGGGFKPQAPELDRAHVTGEFDVQATWYRIPIRVYSEIWCAETEACYAQVCVEIIGQTVCKRESFREREQIPAITSESETVTFSSESVESVETTEEVVEDSEEVEVEEEETLEVVEEEVEEVEVVEEVEEVEVVEEVEEVEVE